MKLKYLGTAAAEGIPGLFCQCEKCRLAREKGGKDIRTRSQALVDEKILLDLNADTFDHMIRFGLDLTKVRACLITHVHEDHLYPRELDMLRAGFTHEPEGYPPFTVYGSEETRQVLAGSRAAAGDRLSVIAVKPFVPFEVEGYRVTALKANHGTKQPLIYLIEKDSSALLYAHDTGLFPDETWAYLKKVKPHLTLASLDCTEGMREELPYGAHMCLGRARRCRTELQRAHLADGNTKFVLNHFSHNGDLILFDDLAPTAASEGFEVSWDGRELEC